MLKNSFRNYETVAKMGRSIFRAFQCEMELDYITVSRLLLASVAKGLWKQAGNLPEFILADVLRSAALCIRLRNILLKWFETTVLIFRVFQPIARRSNIFIRNTLERIHKSYLFSENDSKREITLAKNLLLKESKLPISLENFFQLQLQFFHL